MVPSEDPLEDCTSLDLGSLLTFITGSDHPPPPPPPPIGFSNESEIKFEVGFTRMLPTASTCGPTLYLPITLTDPDTFKNKMDVALICAHGFGSV